jgi:hypothetical protein
MQLTRCLFLVLAACTAVCSAIRCTDNCTYTVPLDQEFFISESCTQMSLSAGKCDFQLMIWYDRREYTVSLKASSSSSIMSNQYHAMAQLSSKSPIAMSYSVAHSCKNTDDCAREFGRLNGADIVGRPRIDLVSLAASLEPLLAADSVSSTVNPDLACFENEQDVRQCAISGVRGVCELSDDLIRKKTKRQCDQELVGSDRFVSAHEFGNAAYFSFKCNRPLCNGHLTTQAVKEAFFKHNITKTIEGRMNAAATVSSPLLLNYMSFAFLLSLLFVDSKCQ